MQKILAVVGSFVVALAATTSAPTASRFSGVFNVKDFGAVGDGRTDDRKSIQDAANALRMIGRGVLLFPPGEYRISGFVEIQRLNAFDISASGATLRPMDSVSRTDSVGDALRITNCSSFSVTGLHIDGNSQWRGNSEGPQSMRLKGCSDFRIIGCTFTNAVSDHLYISASKPQDHTTGCHDGLIQGCTFRGAYRNAISVIHGYGLKIIDNNIRDVVGTKPASGIDIEANEDDADGANHDILISGNTIAGCAETGVRITATQNPSYVSIEHNLIENCPSGVRVNGHHCRVSNNLFRNAKSPESGPGSGALGQIVVAGASFEQVHISGNKMHSIKGVSGIHLHGTFGGSALIQNNQFFEVAGGKYSAINVDSSDASIIGNVIEKMPEGGLAIRVSGARAVIENNLLRNGVGSAIWCGGSNHTIRGNTVIDFGLSDAGRCLQTIDGSGGSVIEGNVIRKTTPNREWEALLSNPNDYLGKNFRQGTKGSDGPF